MKYIFNGIKIRTSPGNTKHLAAQALPRHFCNLRYLPWISILQPESSMRFNSMFLKKSRESIINQTCKSLPSYTPMILIAHDYSFSIGDSHVKLSHLATANFFTSLCCDTQTFSRFSPSHG